MKKIKSGVYLLESETLPGLYKIGYAKDIDKRIKSLNNLNSHIRSLKVYYKNEKSCKTQITKAKNRMIKDLKGEKYNRMISGPYSPAYYAAAIPFKLISYLRLADESELKKQEDFMHRVFVENGFIKENERFYKVNMCDTDAVRELFLKNADGIKREQSLECLRIYKRAMSYYNVSVFKSKLNKCKNDPFLIGSEHCPFRHRAVVPYGGKYVSLEEDCLSFFKANGAFNNGENLMAYYEVLLNGKKVIKKELDQLKEIEKNSPGYQSKDYFYQITDHFNWLNEQLQKAA